MIRIPRGRLLAALTVAPLLLLLCPPPLAADQPEVESGFTEKTAVHAKSFMIAAANPHAVQVGYQILKQGGTATDAAIAAMLVLGLVEPQSAGIGGGGYLLHWSAADRRIDFYDGQVMAPAAARPDRFLRPDGRPVSRQDAQYGGRTVAVPGLVRLLAAAHATHGSLPWPALFEPAIRLAEDGFAISPRLHKEVRFKRKHLTQPAARAYFLDANEDALPVGHKLANKEYAATLRAIAAQGPDAFYRGAIGRDVAVAVSAAPDHPVPMTEADLSAYAIKTRPPICIDYRRHRLCSAPPSSSGGLTVLMTLGQLERFDLAATGLQSAEAAHLFIESYRLAYADRTKYVADPEFIAVPAAGLLDPAYLARRSGLIDPSKAMSRAAAGEPPMRRTELPAPDDDSRESPTTTHLSVVDADGNAVSLTASIGRGLGSGLMVRGFLLNNQMTSFSFQPASRGVPVANRIEPGKRPRSSMAPSLVFRPDGRLRLVIGSPGGNRIAGYVAQALVNVLDCGMDVQEAISAPHIGAQGQTAELEKDTTAVTQRAALEAMGHQLTVNAMTSGLHGIEITENGLVGGADPRREGIVMGD